jgi:hypothetical protein
MLVHYYAHLGKGESLVRLARGNGLVRELIVFVVIKLLLLAVLCAVARDEEPDNRQDDPA